MGRILALLLGLGVLCWVAYRVVYSRTGADGATVAPTQPLQNARDAAKRIERDDEKRAQDILDKTNER